MTRCCDREKWLPVVGYKGSYEVSSCGRVRRVTHGTVPAGDKTVRDRWTCDTCGAAFRPTPDTTPTTPLDTAPPEP